MTLLPKVKLKAAVNFPAQVLDGTGIDVTKSNGTYRFDLDFADFAPPVGSVSDAAHQNALLWNSVTGSYTLAPMALLAGSSIPEAPNDGLQYGRQSLGWTQIVIPAAITPSGSLPVMNGIAAAGAAVTYSRGDHVHPTDTSITSFVQSGTGAVTRTMQNKARDIVNVRDFGAVGDGVADDTAAITAAITSLPAGGGTIQIPPGVFLVTSVSVIAGVTLQGAGQYATEIRTTSSSAHAVVLAGAGSVIRDCYITSSIAAASRTGAGVRITGSILAGVQRCRIVGHNNGIWTTGAATELSYCLVSGAKSHGIVLDGQLSNMNETSVVNCQSNGNGGDGFLAIGGNGGAPATQTAGMYFYRPTAAHNTANGMRFVSGCNDVYITAPEMSTNGARNIDMELNGPSASCSVVGGLIESSTSFAIWIGQNVAGFSVTGATITTSAVSGIINDGIDSMIVGNVFAGGFVGGAPIELASHSVGAAITGNTLSPTLAGGTIPSRAIAVDPGAGAFTAAGNNFTNTTSLAISGTIPAGTALAANKGHFTTTLGVWASNADAAINGYINVIDSTGTTRKMATIA